MHRKFWAFSAGTAEILCAISECWRLKTSEVKQAFCFHLQLFGAWFFQLQYVQNMGYALENMCFCPFKLMCSCV